jgi:hypothetical protein
LPAVLNHTLTAAAESRHNDYLVDTILERAHTGQSTPVLYSRDPKRAPLRYIVPRSFMARLCLRSCNRSVCTTFRLIADQLPFWLAYGFTFGTITPRNRSRFTKSFPRTMLQDRHSLECLGRKKGWTLGVDEFDYIFQSLPSMADVTTRLMLQHGNCISSPLTVETPTALKDFKSLEYLDLILLEPIRIAQLPSSLRTLNIKSGQFSASSDPRVLRGLNQVQNLHKYSFNHLRGHLGTLTPFLPLASSATLSALTFIKPPGSYAGPGCDILDTFCNLKELELANCANAFFLYL